MWLGELIHEILHVKWSVHLHPRKILHISVINSVATRDRDCSNEKRMNAILPAQHYNCYVCVCVYEIFPLWAVLDGIFTSNFDAISKHMQTKSVQPSTNPTQIYKTID